VDKSTRTLRLSTVRLAPLAAHEALVRVLASSVNRGELRALRTLAPGTVPGWDLAGTIERAAGDGSGPPVGTAVVGLRPASGAWAQLVPVSTEYLAPLPRRVSVEQAAALPVAGLTAVRALDLAGELSERRILVTGAGGAVGRYAVQLARLAGGRILGEDHSATTEMAGGEAELEPADIVLDTVGGEALTRALGRVAAHGVIVTVASSSDTPAVVPAWWFNRQAVLRGMNVFEQLAATGSAAADLGKLVGLVAQGLLDTTAAAPLSWTAPEAVLHAAARRGRGTKTVMRLD
jgi:NADPH:quinone reductase-like Zn-dependent oxidoreductase